MRKLKLQVQMTVDGFIGGPKGEMDFMVWDWDDAIQQYVEELTAPVDCIVLGRKLAEGFIPHWAGVAANATHPEFAAGQKFTATPKVVFSRTLAQSPWENTVLAKGELADEINRLKSQPGQDIIAYGGATFVSALIQHGLVDEFHLFINPAAIGSGMSIFKGLKSRQDLKLVRSIPFPCGIVVLNYALIKSDLPKLGQPAQRALSGAGIRSLEQLSGYGAEEIRLLHGVGPNALKTLREALSAKGLTFKKEA